MKKTLIIEGMHCKSCEILIEEKIKKIDNSIRITTLSRRKGTLTCDVKNNAQLTEIKKILTEAGYPIKENNQSVSNKSNNNINRTTKVLIILGLGLILYSLNKVDIMSNILPQYDTLTRSVALLIGLIASVSTCLAVTGGIIIGYTENVNDKRPRKTQLMFHLGRVIAFIIGGYLLGKVGGEIMQTTTMSIIITIFVGGVLLLLGLQLLGFFKKMPVRFHRPVRITKKTIALKDPKYSPLVGALTFFLPCGFTQAVQLFALQSGSGLQGGLILGMFALGTLPVLLGIGVATDFIKRKISFLNLFIAALLVIFGGYTIMNGIQLYKATTLNIHAGSIEQQEQSADAPIQYEEVSVSHDGRQFVPNQIVLSAGSYYKITVTPESNGIGCMSHLARGGKAIPIRENEPFVLEINGTNPGRIQLVCASMGMRQGTIIIQ